jgi:hypothetical protein
MISSSIYQTFLPFQSTLKSGSSWLFSLFFSVSIFLAPALWNGFAIVFFDTGGYVERVLDMNLAPGRSLFYGLFLWAASLGWWSFWGPVLVQSLGAVWVIRLMLHCHCLPSGPLATAVLSGTLGTLTGISWYTSQLMPDILVSLATLSLWLLAVDWKRQCWTNRVGLIALCLLGLMSHMSCMALAIGLILVIAFIRGLSQRRQWSLSISIVTPATVVLASLLFMPFLHLVLVGQGGFTPGGPVFVFGRLVQDGLAQRWLAEHCPAPGIKLCGMQTRLPKTADDFLWGNDSPFQDLGGWGGEAETELTHLVEACIKAYPYTFVWTSLRATAQQMALVATGDGLDEFQPAARGTFTNLLPRTAASFNAALQQKGRITQPLFDALNIIHVSIAYLSMLGLLIILGWGLHKKHHDLAALSFFILLALLGNAMICGALSNPHDRYQSRLIWIATLVCGMAVSCQRQDRRARTSSSIQPR